MCYIITKMPIKGKNVTIKQYCLPLAHPNHKTT